MSQKIAYPQLVLWRDVTCDGLTQLIGRENPRMLMDHVLAINDNF